MLFIKALGKAILYVGSILLTLMGIIWVGNQSVGLLLVGIIVLLVALFTWVNYDAESAKKRDTKSEPPTFM